MRERGRVVAFNAAEGHGTVRSMVRGDELFVHFSFFAPDGGFRALRPGQVVEFRRELQPGPSGDRAVAQSVIVVPPTGAEVYAQLIAAIGHVVTQVDPMNLLATGSPRDEYEAEVAKLAPRVARASSRDALAHATAAVFDEAFGAGSVPPSVIERLVEGLWPLVQATPGAG